MSDMLIKGMEMPSCCYGCPLVYDMGEGNYACPFFNGYAPINERRDDCPLVELPPHGRLIDADKIELGYDPHFGGRMIATSEAIANAPTILEASDENS